MASPRDARQILRDVFGYPEFRPGQEAIVDALVQGRDAVALLPTGGGKSLCYQIPAIVRPGTGLVISPLVALMTDQVAALEQAGVAAACIHGGLSPRQVDATLEAFVAGRLDVLYVAPERARTERFRAHLRRARVGLVAVDEAHCVDKWGHDFREDYLGLHELRPLTGDAPWFACTATADHRSLTVIREQLRMSDAEVFQGSYDRPNLHYEVLDHAVRADELASWLRATHPGEAGIVYCRSRRRTEELAKQLREQGVKALAYHAGLDDLLRRTLEARFRSEDGLVVCATVAFGMGIDRSDVRFVVHAEPPDSMDAYVQESGRAGRDGLPASTRLHVDGRTIAQTLRNLDSDASAEAQVRRSRFRAFMGYLAATTCRRQVLLGFFGERHPGDCGRCDNCRDPPETWDAQDAARAVRDAVTQTGQRFGSSHLIDVLHGKTTPKVRQTGHHNLPVFGRGTRWDAPRLQAVVRHLMACGALRADQYGGLSLADGSGPWDAPLPLRHPRMDRRTAAPKRTVSVTADLPEPDQALWEALRSRRKELAVEHGVPAYVIFHDATLKDIARERPRDGGEFLAISGVGRAKLERYGAAFLAVVAEHGGDATSRAVATG